MTAFLVQVHQATASCSSWTAAQYLTCLISEPSGSNQKWRVTTPIHRRIAAAAKACDAATMCTLMLAMACSCEPASGGSLTDHVKICALSTLQRAHLPVASAACHPFPRFCDVCYRYRAKLAKITARHNSSSNFPHVRRPFSVTASSICLHMSSSVFDEDGSLPILIAHTAGAPRVSHTRFW